MRTLRPAAVLRSLVLAVRHRPERQVAELGFAQIFLPIQAPREQNPRELA